MCLVNGKQGFITPHIYYMSQCVWQFNFCENILQSKVTEQLWSSSNDTYILNWIIIIVQTVELVCRVYATSILILPTMEWQMGWQQTMLTWAITCQIIIVLLLIVKTGGRIVYVSFFWFGLNNCQPSSQSSSLRTVYHRGNSTGTY